MTSAISRAATSVELFLRSCSDNANSVLLIEGQSSATYREVLAQATACAASLVRLGVEPGDRVAHWMGNGIPWAVVKFGIEMAGAVHVPMNTHLRTEDATYILAQSRARALVVGCPPVNHDMVLSMVAPSSRSAGAPSAVDRLPALKTVIGLGVDAPGIVPFDDFRSASWTEDVTAELRRRQAALSPDDVVNILYTSGTTGSPKGAVITHGNVVANAAAGPTHINRTAEDRWLVALPLFHTFGCMMGLVYPMSLGASSVLLPRFDAGAAMRAIEQQRCTVLEGVPTMFSDMLEHPQRVSFDLSSWRKLYVGGAHTSQAFLTRLRDGLGVEETLTGFGMTEHTGLSCATHVGDPFSLISRTIGEPLQDAVEFSIRDADSGAALPAGVEGEICARGPSVCRGYFEKPAETASAFHKDGWMRSGDLGMIDLESGYYRITGRLKEMIICGGENISPAEIEGLISRHPAVSEVYVCGVPDKRLGEVPAVFIRTKQHAALSAEEIIGYCRERAASIKVPRHVFFADSFPQTPSGKIQRFRLREMAISELNAAKHAATSGGSGR